MAQSELDEMAKGKGHSVTTTASEDAASPAPAEDLTSDSVGKKLFGENTLSCLYCPGCAKKVVTFAKEVRKATPGLFDVVCRWCIWTESDTVICCSECRNIIARV